MENKESNERLLLNHLDNFFVDDEQIQLRYGFSRADIRSFSRTTDFPKAVGFPGRSKRLKLMWNLKELDAWVERYMEHNRIAVPFPSTAELKELAAQDPKKVIAELQ